MDIYRGLSQLKEVERTCITLFFMEDLPVTGSLKVPLMRNGFRMVVFSIIIMIVVLFFRRGIMGDKELTDLFRRRKKAVAAKEERA